MSAQRHRWQSRDILVRGWLLYQCVCGRWNNAQQYLSADSQEEAVQGFLAGKGEKHAGRCQGDPVQAAKQQAEAERQLVEWLRRRGWTCIPPEGDGEGT